MSKAMALLFEQIVKMDLEGIVCKRKDSPYKVTDKSSRYWIKVKNPRYSVCFRQACVTVPPES
jgi:ATP-dependent DNA ligase